MDLLTVALVDSWDRQARMLNNLCARIAESNSGLRPSPNGWAISEHLAHVHEVRYSWLSKFSPHHAATVGEVYVQEGDRWVPIDDLDEIKHQLGLSAQAVRDAFIEAVAQGRTDCGPYANPVLFLQHMVWHEGWHFGLIMLALRNGDQEPPEAWEEENVWGLWRTE